MIRGKEREELAAFLTHEMIASGRINKTNISKQIQAFYRHRPEFVKGEPEPELLKPIMCYKISAEAGLARNTVTDEYAPAYMQISLEGGKDVDRETYDEVHKQLVGNVATQMSIPEEWVVPISIEEYDKEHEEEEE